MGRMELQVAVPQDRLAELCRRHHIRKMALFGSVLGAHFSPESDVDVLVEFEPEAQVTLFDMGEVQIELSEMLGREVDLKTIGFLSPYFRRQVLDSARVIYERG